MKKDLKTTILVIAAGILFAFTTYSCRKEKPTVAKIHVVDTMGEPVNNAMVRLYGTSTISPPRAIVLDDTLYTKSDGSVIFDYSDNFNLGQAGFTVLDIEVVAEAYSGVGIIKIEPEKTNEETVILQ
jgi:hypothetical protein